MNVLFVNNLQFMRRSVAVTVAFLLFLLNVTGFVLAAVPRVEGASQSAVIGKNFPKTIEKTMDEAQLLRSAEAVKKALDEVESALLAISKNAVLTASPEYGAVFFVQTIQLQAPQLLSRGFWDPLVQPFERREQTMQTLQGLVDRITAEYRRRGFLSSQAYIAPQEIKDGIFTISVLEGRVGRIIFEGNRHYSSELLRRYCRIKEGDFFNYLRLRATVARLNDHPDRVVRAVIRRGDVPGTTDIIFKVEEKAVLVSSVFADNQGSKPVGQDRLGLGLRRNNVLGQDDILRMGVMMGQDFGSGFVEHALPIEKINSIWKTGVSYARSLPKKQYKPYGVSSTTMDYWGKLETSLIKDETLALDWRTGLDFKESRTMFLSGTDSRDRLRVLRFGPTVTMRDDWGGTVIDNQFSLGLNTLGAALYRASSQRSGVTPNFFVSDLGVERIQRMPLGTRLSVKGKAHLSPDKQPSSEQMSLGGADTVRGYPEGDYFADQGVLVSAEYLVPFFFLPDGWTMPGSKGRLRDRLDFAVFFDEGYGRFKSPAADQKTSERLRGAGVGVRARVSDDIYFTTDFAWAIGAAPNASDDRFRIHSGLQANF